MPLFNIRSSFSRNPDAEFIDKLIDISIDLKNNNIPEYEIRKILFDKSKTENKYRSDITSNRIVEQVIKCSKKMNTKDNNIISFSVEEIDFIHSIGDEFEEKEMFLLFCMYKYYGDGFKIPDKEFAKELSVGTKKLFFGNILKNENKDNVFFMNMNSNYIDRIFASDYVKSLYNESNICLVISNYKNIVYYYDYYFNPNNYFFCDRCSCIERVIKNNQKYCKECAREVKNNVVHEEKRFIECSSCGKVFCINPKSKRSLCDQCYLKDLNKRKNKNK